MLLSFAFASNLSFSQEEKEEEEEEDFSMYDSFDMDENTKRY